MLNTMFTFSSQDMAVFVIKEVCANGIKQDYLTWPAALHNKIHNGIDRAHASECSNLPHIALGQHESVLWVRYRYSKSVFIG